MAQPDLEKWDIVTVKGIFKSIKKLVSLVISSFKSLLSETEQHTLIILEYNNTLYWSYTNNYNVRLLTTEEAVTLCKDSFLDYLITKE